MAKKYDLEHYLRQLRKIEEHREQGCEQNVRRLYQELLTDLEGFLGETYSELAENDMLTYEILHSKGKYAKFLETVDKKVNDISPEISSRIKSVVQDTYKMAYDGMVKAVRKSSTYNALKSSLKGVRAATPDVIKRAIENPISGLTLNDTLEKNRQNIIYDIKQSIGIGLSQGDRMSTMARRITEKVDMSYRKAIRIVRTETHRVREAGYQDASERVSQALKDSGSDYVMTKTWKTMQDEAVRPQRRYKTKKGWKTSGRTSGPNHMKMHGVTVLVDEKFDLGGGIMTLAPGQSGVAGHDINCRCYLSRDLMTKAEYSALTGKTIEESMEDMLRKEEQKLLAEKKQLLQDRQDAETEQETLLQKTFTVGGKKLTLNDYLHNHTSYNDMRAEYAHLLNATNTDDIEKLLADLNIDVKDAAKSLGKYFEKTLGSRAKQYGLTEKQLVKLYSTDIDSLKKHVTRATKSLHDLAQTQLDAMDELIDAAKHRAALQAKIAQIDADLLSISDDLVVLNKRGAHFSNVVKDEYKVLLDEMNISTADRKKIATYLNSIDGKIDDALSDKIIIRADMSKIKVKDVDNDEFARLIEFYDFDSPENLYDYIKPDMTLNDAIDLLYQHDDIDLINEIKKDVQTALDTKRLKGTFTNKVVTIDDLTDAQLDVVETLEKVIKKNKLSKDMVVTGYFDDDFLEKEFGIGKNATLDDILDALKGKSYTEKTYLRTTLKDKSGKVKVRINAKQGTNALLSDDLDNMEVLFGRGAKLDFKDVVKDADGNIVIIADLVGFDIDEKLINTIHTTKSKRAIVKAAEKSKQLTPAQLREFEELVNDWSDEQVKVYAKYTSTKLSTNDYHYTDKRKGAHYDPNVDMVRMDIDNIAKERALDLNKTGAWQNKFHEEFHQIDHTLFGTTGRWGPKITNKIRTEQFEQVFTDDLNKLAKKLVGKTFKTFDDAFNDVTFMRALKRHLNDNYYTYKSRTQINMFTDALGLISQDRFSPHKLGFWGHSSDYNKSRASRGAASETWATFGGLMFSNDIDTMNEIKKLMPDTWELMEEWFKTLVVPNS